MSETPSIPTSRIVRASKVPKVVNCREAATPGTIITAHGPVPYDAGDWIITDPDSGDTWPVRAAIFERTYIIVQEDDIT